MILSLAHMQTHSNVGILYDEEFPSLRLQGLPSLKQGDDVMIIGAGPAGATLAYELSKRGIGVLLLEKERLPRYKCCAGGVTSKAAKLLDFDITEVAEAVIYRVDITFQLSGTYTGQHSQPLVYTVMRDVFDTFLIRKAQECGATFVDGQTIGHVRVDGDSVKVFTADNAFRSRLVVGADGAYSVVARELGIARSIEFSAAIGSEIVVPGEELARWKSRAQMELGCIPGGYAWVFPKRSHLSVGVGCSASRARQLTHHHREFLDSIAACGYTVSRSGSHLIPTCRKGVFVWQDKALLIGDAAGLADPLTGEGIHNAILSAQLAAPVIEKFLAGGNSQLDDYQHAIEKRIMPELRIARQVSRIHSRFPRLIFALFHRTDGAWRAGCALMSGELTYADIKRRAGGFKGMVDHLFRP